MHQVQLVLQVQRELLELRELQVQLVRRVLLELQVRVRRGQQGPQARLELRGPQGLLVPQVQLVQRLLVRQE